MLENKVSCETCHISMWPEQDQAAVPGSVPSPSRGSCCEGRGAAPAGRRGVRMGGMLGKRGMPGDGCQSCGVPQATPGPYLRELLVLALGDDRLLPEHAGAQIGGRRRHGRRVLQGIIVAEGAARNAEGQRHPARAGPAARLQRCGESAALSARRRARAEPAGSTWGTLPGASGFPELMTGLSGAR